jgi:ATP-binding cassette subfamily B protein
MFLIILKISIPKFKAIQTITDKLNLRTMENIKGIRVIRAFNAQEEMQEKFSDVNAELTKTNLFVNRIMSFLHPGITIIQNITAIFVIYLGSKYIGKGELLVGDMIAFLQYSLQIIFSFSMISMVGIMLPKAMVSLNRIAEICDTDISIKDNEVVLSPDFITYPYLEFNNVSFLYKNASKAVISNISFKAYLGTTTAIIGSTGSGKSTIAKLIPRFYDVSDGEIKIGGIDIRNMAQKSLRNLLGYIPQKSILFSGTVEENINYTMQNRNMEELNKVAEISQAKDFIEAMPEKYNSFISEGGTNLSGGQKQRLSIARAIFKNPKIYVFDDSFSALDYKTDLNLRNSLKKIAKDKIQIIISQRINTIMNADNIIVLDGGNIVGQGTHNELIKSCQIYREIKQSQE